MHADTLFGREPAAWIGLIEAGIALLTITVLHWSTEQIALVMAVVMAIFGVYTAWVTHDTLLGVIVGLVKAVLALLVGFGVSLSPDLTAAIIGFATVALGFFNRQQTFPVAFPPVPTQGAVAVSDVGTA
jgi:intracellular septation protein A